MLAVVEGRLEAIPLRNRLSPSPGRCSHWRWLAFCRGLVGATCWSLRPASLKGLDRHGLGVQRCSLNKGVQGGLFRVLYAFRVLLGRRLRAPSGSRLLRATWRQR